MRRLRAWGLSLLLITGVLLAPGCKKKRQHTFLKSADDGMLASMVQVADPRAAVQLVKGFYQVEGNAWRWTASHFTVALRPPRNAAQNGARLVLKFVIPDVVLQKLHSIKVSAKVNGLDLPPQEYTQAGEQTYSHDVAASALTSDVVNADFALDKFLPPSPPDKRELGVIASAVGFEAK